MKKILFAAVAVLALGAAALAQTATAPIIVPPTPPVETVVSVGTIAGQILTWIATAFSLPIGAFLVGWLFKAMKLAGVQVTGAMKDQLQATIVNGLNAAAANASERLRGVGPIEVKNAIVLDAIRYTQEHAAETLKGLGLNPESGEAVEAIKARIETAIVDPTVPTPPIITPVEGQKVGTNGPAFLRG